MCFWQQSLEEADFLPFEGGALLFCNIVCNALLFEGLYFPQILSNAGEKTKQKVDQHRFH